MKTVIANGIFAKTLITLGKNAHNAVLMNG